MKTRSKTPSPEARAGRPRWLSEERAGALGNLVAGSLALALVTCAATTRRVETRTTLPPAATVAVPAPAPAPSAAPVATAETPPAPGALGRFRDALDGLAAKRRS